MRIQRVRVEGYKNLVVPVELCDLGGIVVLHGANDVGKSNLLEAIGLPFRLLATCDGQRRAFPDPAHPHAIEADAFVAATGLDLAHIWNFAGPVPIRVRVTLDPTGWELPNGLAALRDVTLEVEIARRPGQGGAAWSIRRFDADGGQSKRADLLKSPHLAALAGLATRMWTATGPHDPTFQLVQVDRTVLGDRAAARSPYERGLIASDVALRLYDAKEAVEAALHAPWEAFRAAMAPFDDILGGEPGVVYSRLENTATLVVDRAGVRHPAHVLGSGVQQVLGLVARLVTVGADVVAIEEPELNLRLDLQDRLRDALRAMVDSPAGPSQVILASHSPVWERGGAFFWLQRQDGVVTATRRPASDAPSVTGMVVDQSVPAAAVAPSHLSSDGYLRVSPQLAAHIGLPHGGMVAMVSDDDPASLRAMSVDTWLRWVGDE